MNRPMKSRSATATALAKSVSVLVFATFATFASGCGSGGGGGAPADFSGAPVTTVMTAAGTYSVATRTSPNPITRGVNSLELTVLDAKSAPASNVTVTAVPWMPAMGHGSSTVPTITNKGEGVYLLDDVNLFMPGRWEVRLTLAGGVTDTSTLVFDVP